MSNVQKIIAAITLGGVSLFLHMFHCNWLIASSHTLTSTDNGGGHMTIVEFASNSGILGRSRETVSQDAVFGVAVPLLLIGTACFIVAAPRKQFE